MLPRRRRPLKMGVRDEVRRSFPGHRRWVRSHHCVVGGCTLAPIECCHVWTGDLPAEDRGAKMQKPHDRSCLPLCVMHHREQTNLGEREFSRRYKLDLPKLAAEFAAASPHRHLWSTP